MTQEQIKDLREWGFQISEEDVRGRTMVSKETMPDLLSLEMLILTMTFKDEIFFWNYYGKTISDPGSYVTAIRWDNETVAYKEANHGWSGSWKLMPIAEMAKLMQINWDKDCDRGAFLNQIRIEKSLYITKNDMKKKLNIK